ncbi:MAG: hypothetical protein KKD38_01910 [Candidatus Delongbacteria bacterium]|nr:hypothetical protein [Candidatus Delongbacteria bacterium]MCG2761114.1 hypothetical protein [Candidatus Delongbacteria bacterium]
MFIKKELNTPEIREKIEKAISPIAEKYGQEVVDIILSSNSKGTLIKVSVGSKKGPTVSDLTAISKDFNKLADSPCNKLLSSDFQLEVSSPGIDRELRSFRDFYWNEDREIRILLKGEEKNVNIEGKLIRALENKIILLFNDSETEISYADIIKAKLKIKF